MKIKVKNINYENFLSLQTYKHVKPKKRSWLLASLIRLISIIDLIKVGFKFKAINMNKLNKKEPCLILMNHSSFIDLKIASKLLYPRKYNIVSTDDGFVGKELLMRYIGCVPTKKFVTDPILIKDMMHCIKKLKSSILMYPEAGYSFDGTATTLPSYIGKCVKFLNIPVVMITTYGAFSRDPLYNNLQIRKVKISANIEYILSKEEIINKTEDELTEIINKNFQFDQFKWQQNNKISITESFRADHLNRVLYKCPHCMSEGKMEGKGDTITCNHCNNSYHLDQYGYLKNKNGETIFDSVPKWYKWERECVRDDILNNKYHLNTDVDIYALIDLKQIYKIGFGKLKHSSKGFYLNGCEGKLSFKQNISSSYSLNSDFNWYELGDVICIGNEKIRYYCIPKNKNDIVAKTRLATEELYKIHLKMKKTSI